jgi:hypothetical protein
MELMRYDMATDQDVPVTQEDIDKYQRTEQAFGQLAKKIKFYIAEARNGLLRFPELVSDLEKAIKEADETAATFDIEQKMEVGTRKVLVIER